jgi:hypothetical protein
MSTYGFSKLTLRALTNSNLIMTGRPLSALLLCFVLAFAALIVGCSNSTNSNPVTPAPPQAQVRLYHAVPGGANVDVFNNDTIKVLGNIAYDSVTAYALLNLGRANFKIQQTNTSLILGTLPVTLLANEKLSVVATGVPSSTSALILNDTVAVPVAGKAFVRFVHVVPSAPAVNIRISVVNQPQANITNLSFRGNSGYSSYAVGNVGFTVTTADTSAITLTNLSRNLESGKVYTVFIRGTSQAVGIKVGLEN